MECLPVRVAPSIRDVTVAKKAGDSGCLIPTSSLRCEVCVIAHTETPPGELRTRKETTGWCRCSCLRF